MIILTDFKDISNIWECSAYTMSHQGIGLRVLKPDFHEVKDSKSHDSVSRKLSN
jgi:hypothetical protein